MLLHVLRGGLGYGRAYGPEELRAPMAATPVAAHPSLRCGWLDAAKPSPQHPAVRLGAYLASGHIAGQGQGTLAALSRGQG